MDVYATIEELFVTRGRSLYFGEAVSEAEHHAPHPAPLIELVSYTRALSRA